MKKDIIKECKIYIKELFSFDHSGHDYLHSIRVYNTAMYLAKDEKDIDLEVIALASLLHDVDDYKLFDSKNYNNAKAFLEKEKVESSCIDKIIDVIKEVPYKAKESARPHSKEGEIVQDADRLDALGAIGIARAFSYGGKHDRDIYSEDKIIKNNNLTFEEYKNLNSDTISHFYVKLLHLSSLMNTKKGKEEAIRRTKYLQDFLDEFFKEVNMK